eukprot:TRINITY_DN4569_c0_g1_i9.p1 TRINITY_DN4569_c0_g1~~TRINITY_DN4569_c0_g1_i9.p1  ORF type:complete len:251 (-),score=43.30 TRINITY_DN4569_c0_g1_i9:371-1123(-)
MERKKLVVLHCVDDKWVEVEVTSGQTVRAFVRKLAFGEPNIERFFEFVIQAEEKHLNHLQNATKEIMDELCARPRAQLLKNFGIEPDFELEEEDAIQKEAELAWDHSGTWLETDPRWNVTFHLVPKQTMFVENNKCTECQDLLTQGYRDKCRICDKPVCNKPQCFRYIAGIQLKVSSDIVGVDGGEDFGQFSNEDYSGVLACTECADRREKKIDFLISVFCALGLTLVQLWKMATLCRRYREAALFVLSK